MKLFPERFRKVEENQNPDPNPIIVEEQLNLNQELEDASSIMNIAEDPNNPEEGLSIVMKKINISVFALL